MQAFLADGAVHSPQQDVECGLSAGFGEAVEVVEVDRENIPVALLSRYPHRCVVGHESVGKEAGILPDGGEYAGE